jgi:OOP family OmpA-OmpF porin
MNSLLLSSTLQIVPLSFAVVAPEDAAPQEASAGAEGDASISLGGGGSANGSSNADGTKTKLSKRTDQKWINRWAPERMMGELGIYLGVFFPHDDIELFKPDIALPEQGQKAFKNAFDVGLRAGFYPLRFLGAEVEGGIMPSKTTDDGDAMFWTARGHVVGQLGLWSVTPFVLVGGGGIGVSSGDVGNDTDALMHYGGGVKIYINRWTQVRLDIRDNLSPGQGVGDGAAHSPEVLLGFALTLGRKKDEQSAATAGPIDTDGDGFMDPDDSCVNEPGIAPDGCPEGDRDADGFLDGVDKCPDEAGVAPDGCPILDTDGDGILDPNDKCVEEPETKNNFQDEDGCPDEIPKEIAKFNGAIKGIYFDVNKDKIKSKSRVTLDKAVKVLKQFPTIRLEVSGHTDGTGGRDHNIDLSGRRAEAVKKYLTDAGIDASRLETRGAGPDQPIGTNDTREGRATNRRIEFKLLGE